MFDGISLNARIFGSRFGQTRDHGAHTAPRADGARRQMKFRLPSFLLKSSLFFYNESDHGNRVELSAQKNWAQCSTQRPSAQYFRSIIQPNYHLPLESGQ